MGCLVWCVGPGRPPCAGAWVGTPQGASTCCRKGAGHNVVVLRAAGALAELHAFFWLTSIAPPWISRPHKPSLARPLPPGPRACESRAASRQQPAAGSWVIWRPSCRPPCKSCCRCPSPCSSQGQAVAQQRQQQQQQQQARMVVRLAATPPAGVQAPAPTRAQAPAALASARAPAFGTPPPPSWPSQAPRAASPRGVACSFRARPACGAAAPGGRARTGTTSACGAWQVKAVPAGLLLAGRLGRRTRGVGVHCSGQRGATRRQVLCSHTLVLPQFPPPHPPQIPDNTQVPLGLRG